MSLQGESTSDEAVLAVFPTSVRRRILRQLYAKPLAACYLFQGCGRKFLDAIMTTARVELFLPKARHFLGAGVAWGGVGWGGVGWGGVGWGGVG
jgi:hypothetical protein